MKQTILTLLLILGGAHSFADSRPVPAATPAVKYSKEIDARWVVGNSDYRGGVIDATELGALAEISKGVRAKGLLAFQFLCSVDKSKASCPKDWERFFREAYLQVDLNRVVPQGPNGAILFGRMEVESASSDSALMVDNNAPMFPVTRVRTAYAIRVIVDTKKSRIVDEVSLAAINTGPDDADVQGDLEQKNVSGSMITMSKTVYDRLTLTAGLTHLNYMPKAELRENFDASYKIDPRWKVFVNMAHFTFNPFYENSKSATTVGATRDSTNGIASVELSHVDRQFDQIAFGYLWKVTPVLATGFEARRDWCRADANRCAKSNSRLTWEMRYLYDATGE